MTRHYEFMLGKHLRDLYHELLTQPDAPVKMRCQVLRNLQTYLIEEESKMMKADAECESILTLIYSLTLLTDGWKYEI